MSEKVKSAFFEEFEQYLRRFHANVTREFASGGGGDTRGGMWSRTSEGTLFLDSDDANSHAAMLSKACIALAPEADLSKSAIHSAMQDAVFSVIDLPKSRSRDLSSRVKQAMDDFQCLVALPSQEFECWVEVAGLDQESLPAEFGLTRFAVIGESDISGLAEIITMKHTVDQAGKLVSVGRMAGDLLGRPVAIQRVIARDQNAAIPLAIREVGIALDCLNFLADMIPYNRARLWIPDGQTRKGSSLRFSIASDGSFLHSPKAKFAWKYSLSKLRDLNGVAATSLSRVEALLCQKSRNPVEELLLQGARWIGRAAAADSIEDGLLYSMIALECVATPEKGRCISRRLSRRISRILAIESEREQEFKCRMKELYDLRSELVHDGSLKIADSDRAYLQRVALETVAQLMNSPVIAQLSSLDELRSRLEGDQLGAS